MREKLKVRDAARRLILTASSSCSCSSRATSYAATPSSSAIPLSSLRSCPFPEAAGIPLGLYELPRRSGEAHLYRLNHPLAEAVVARAKGRDLPEAEIQFAYGEHDGKVTLLEPLIGKSGWLTLCLFTVESLDQAEDHLIFAAATDDGEVLDEEAAARLLTLPGAVAGETSGLPLQPRC